MCVANNAEILCSESVSKIASTQNIVSEWNDKKKKKE